MSTASLKLENEKKTKNQFSTWNYQHSKVDRFFLVLAPFLFLIFNTIYWSYFYLWDRMTNRIEHDWTARVRYTPGVLKYLCVNLQVKQKILSMSELISFNTFPTFYFSFFNCGKYWGRANHCLGKRKVKLISAIFENRTEKLSSKKHCSVNILFLSTILFFIESLCILFVYWEL